MKKSILILLHLFSASLLFGQANTQQQKINAVENGLIATKEVVFADSVVPKFNLLDRMKFYKVPSVSITVINNGKVEWSKAYGYAETNRLANSLTLYQAASISKSVNAFGILKLVQDGKLSLDTDIRAYLKTWKLVDNEFSTGKTITLKNLLSHTAGLSTSGFTGYKTGDTIPNINQILNGEKPANSEGVKPILPVGTTFKYSGGGTTITRKIINDNISANYDSLMQALVLKPLKMFNSTFSQPLNKVYKNFACGYDNNMHVMNGKYNTYPEQAPDGLWTTAADLAKFIISIQQALKGNTSVLKQNMAIEMLTPVISSSNSALGTFIIKKGGEKYFTHSGANMGYRGQYYGSFTTGKGIVVLTNSDNGQQLIDEIINGVAVTYKWKNFYNPTVKKLVNVSDTILNKYVGVYYSENPKIKISITKKGHTLELTARQPEKMYPISTDTFFLMSSPDNTCTFTSTNTGSPVNAIEIKQRAGTIIKATRKD